MENELLKDNSDFDLIKEEIIIEEEQDLPEVVKQEFYEDDVNLHKCRQCPKVFEKLYYLNQHEVHMHGKESRFACEKCDKNWMSSSGLKQHLISHSDEKNFKCDQCDRAFKWNHALSRHKKTAHWTSHSNKCELKCRDCDNRYKYKAHFAKHMKYAHATEKPFQCKVCSKSFAVASSLLKHFLAHSENENQLGWTTHEIIKNATGFLKNDFSEYGKESQDLRDVVKEEFNEDAGKPYKCKLCNRAFEKQLVLIYHQADVHGEKGKNGCRTCGKYFISSADLKRHLTKHSGEKNFKCDQCDKSFTRNFGLNIHKRNYHSTKQSFPCEVCSKSFTFASTLKRHFIQTHSEERRYKCEHCTELFKAPHILAHHLRQVHENAGMFPCDLCSKSFFLSSQLKKHLISHSNKREFECDKCDKKFKSKYALTTHIRYTHTTERPFQCKECPKNFSTVSRLRKHGDTHSQDRSFQCDQCAKEYKTPFGLTTHKIQKHATDRKLPCKVCGKQYKDLRTLEVHMHTHNNQMDFEMGTVEKFQDAQVEADEMFNVKVEPVVIHEPEATLEVLYIKEELEEETEIVVKQETEENDYS